MPPLSQRQPAGKQVGVDRTRGIQLIQPRRHSPGRLQQAIRAILASYEPAAQQDQLRSRRPPRALLAAEQAQGFGAATLREAEIARRGGGEGGGIQQLGALRRRAAVPVDRGHRLVDLTQGIPSQARREQHRALIDDQFGLEDPKLVEQGLGMVEVGKGGREITAGVRQYCAFLARGRILQVLATCGPQRLDPGVIPVGPPDITQGQVRRGSPVPGTHFPDQVAWARQQVNGALGVPQGLGVAAEVIQGACPADQDFAGRDAAALQYHGVQDRQAAPGLPGHYPSGTQAGEDLGLVIGVSGLAREPARIFKLLDRFTDIAEIPEHHGDHLVGDRGLRRRRLPSQYLTSGREGFRWPR